MFSINVFYPNVIDIVSLFYSFVSGYVGADPQVTAIRSHALRRSF